MRNLYRNAIILTVAACFTAFNLIGDAARAQTKSAKPTPTPKTKKSPAAQAKATPKPKAKTSPTPKSKTAPEKTAAKPKPAVAKTSSATKPTTKSASTTEQIIVAATASRIRREPAATATQLTNVKLGKTLNVVEKNAKWYRVEYEPGKNGWISKTLVRDYDASGRDDIYREIADKYSKNKSLDFATAAEVADFLKTAQVIVRKEELKADLGFRRLKFLSAALKAVPFGKDEQSPYKNFLRAHEKEVVYSDPSGEWYVRSDLFWELHGKYTQIPIAEEIAWAAAQNPLPGECEGYINCRLYALRAMEGEYLNFYPNGKYAKKALATVAETLGDLVAEMNDKRTFAPLADISERAEFNRFLTELRAIVSKVPDVDKAKPLQQINQLGEGYK